ncbi:hypothetical protein [Telluribacter sp.]|jgi:hypothetical protein|uniref:hypothetical protein n=1 Tax=Telluribacter sp. TaxID=1978767 RepID=UPI002E115E03|nr:hypothetical protein [Telluribacter sp.]
MKKRYASLFAYSLLATLTLYNCKDHETPPPIPDFNNELSGITVETVTIAPPAPVTTQPATFTAPTNTTISSYSGGAPTAAMQSTATTVSNTLSTSEVSAVNAITPAQLDAIANGGTLPSELQTALDKIKGNAGLTSFLASFSLPTVNGTVVNGRTGLPESIEKVMGTQADDACVKAAQDALANVINKLKADAKTQQDKVDADYQKQVADAATAETSCKAGIPANYTTLRTNTKTQFSGILANLDANQAALGSFYGLLKALVTVQYGSTLAAINSLEKADLAACTQKKEATIANANAAKAANTGKVTEALNKGLKTASDKIAELVKACHNQGGGK